MALFSAAIQSFCEMRPGLQAVASFLLASGLLAQTTQGLIYGRVYDRNTNLALEAARVVCTHGTLVQPLETMTGHDGSFVFPAVSPGKYQIRVSSPGYQDQEMEDLELVVASRIRVRFLMRPSWDLWGQGSSRFTYGLRERLVNFYASDARELRSANADLFTPEGDVLSTGTSFVVTSELLRFLPLPGRDTYTALVGLPGVTSDTSTSRGLGLSVNGQRSTASNFMLDGLEMNNYLLSGPLLSLAPEAIQEYRISTNNFSAEYGRTAGFLANAISKEGTSTWHGQAYSYLKNQALNANDTQRKLDSLSRRSLHESQVGAVLGGPLRPSGMFGSGAVERLSFRTDRDAARYHIPSAISTPSNPATNGARLLQQFGAGPAGTYEVNAPSTLERTLAVLRIDTHWSGGSRLMARFAAARSNRPDFSWTPYRDFLSGLNQDATSAAVSGSHRLASTSSIEWKGGWSGDNAGYDRAKPEIPYLYVTSVTGQTQLPILLPGSRLSREYRNSSSNWEGSATITRVSGRHTWKAGGGLLARRLDGYWRVFPTGSWAFRSLDAFLKDRLDEIEIPTDGLASRLVRPPFERSYRYLQPYGFVQSSLRRSAKLQVDFGLRYEYFSAPANAGMARDALLEWGEGASVDQKLRTSRLVRSDSGGKTLHAVDHNDFAPRIGLAYRFWELRGPTVRAAYGVYYDRPFDNLWQSVRINGIGRATAGDPPSGTDYLSSLDRIITAPGLNWNRERSFYGSAYAYQQGLRTPYIQSAVVGLSQSFTEHWGLEIAAAGSTGRKLIATDKINRGQQPNGTLPEIYYRSSQGGSTYSALTARLRMRSALADFNVSYSWSHTIDNQSDVLAGEFADLSPAFAGLRPALSARRASFSQVHDSRHDRGNADFDQRHNLVLIGVWNVPALAADGWQGGLLRNWRISHLAAFRSGQPFTAIDRNGDRVDVLDPARPYQREGTRVLRAESFGPTRPGSLSLLGRNALIGPGFFSFDLSVARSVRIPSFPGIVLTLRADAFNFLNHANLGNPTAILGAHDFGIARHGRIGRDPGLPMQLPLAETARNVQLLFRVEF